MLLALLAMPARSDVTLPHLFSDHALLQRDRPIHVWGNADPGEAVTVSFRGEIVKTQAGALGRWNAYLAPADAGGPFDLTVAGRNSITVHDVLVGDVWIASGQSNMGFSLRSAQNAEQEIAAANYPKIRLFKVALKTSTYALDDVDGSWQICSPESVPDFTAVGYFFARDLFQKLGAPMGVIESAWGGTPAESWTREVTLAADPALISVFADWARRMGEYPDQNTLYQIRLKEWDENAAKAKTEGKPMPRKPAAPVGPGHPWQPGSLFNAMIAPLVPYPIRGAIWYQGENNAALHRSYVYRRLFQTMITDWRQAWGQGDFPFLFVQLANYAKTGRNSEWPELREAQTMALALRNTGMAVTIDIGNSEDIHPKNKQDVGLRLALAARSIAYGEKLTYSGPIFRQMTREGSTLRVWFDHTGGGLVAKGGGELKGFQIAGSDGKFVPAQARIDGETVIVTSAAVPEPQNVRYAWADSPDCNLYNTADLPASPFRTDQWMDPLVYRGW